MRRLLQHVWPAICKAYEGAGLGRGLLQPLTELSAALDDIAWRAAAEQISRGLQMRLSPTLLHSSLLPAAHSPQAVQLAAAGISEALAGTRHAARLPPRPAAGPCSEAACQLARLPGLTAQAPPVATQAAAYSEVALQPEVEPPAGAIAEKQSVKSAASWDGNFIQGCVHKIVHPQDGGGMAGFKVLQASWEESGGLLGY